MLFHTFVCLVPCITDLRLTVLPDSRSVPFLIDLFYTARWYIPLWQDHTGSPAPRRRPARSASNTARLAAAPATPGPSDSRRALVHRGIGRGHGDYAGRSAAGLPGAGRRPGDGDRAAGGWSV